MIEKKEIIQNNNVVKEKINLSEIKIEEPVISIENLNLNLLDDIHNIPDSFFILNNLHIFTSYNLLNQSCNIFIEKTIIQENITLKKKRKQYIYYIKIKCIKQQIINFIKYIMINYTELPNICFYSPIKYNFPILTDIDKQEILLNKQMYLNK